MRLIPLLFTATLAAAPAVAQQAQPSSAQEQSSSPQAQPAPVAAPSGELPVNLEKIKDALAQTPLLSLQTVDQRPTFRMQIRETQKLDELLSTMNYKAGPTPAGGVYWNELQRQMWNPVDYPYMQPYYAFTQGQLLTILIENLAGKYLAGKALNAVSNAERQHAEAAAREEVQQAIRQFCAAQPNNGSGIQLCSSADR